MAQSLTLAMTTVALTINPQSEPGWQHGRPGASVAFGAKAVFGLFSEANELDQFV